MRKLSQAPVDSLSPADQTWHPVDLSIAPTQAVRPRTGSSTEAARSLPTLSGYKSRY